MDFLSADSLPWLHGPQQRVRETVSARRLPHALLILSVPGLGAEQLANWIAASTLCDSDARRPCGACPSCHLLRADNHPDCYVVRIEEDALQIKVDQIRDLIESLSLSSYRGGYKVGIVEGAEALNVNGANAFLKTLEEPTDNTLADPGRRTEPSPAGDHRQPLHAPAVACAARGPRPLPGWRNVDRTARIRMRRLRWPEARPCWPWRLKALASPHSRKRCRKIFDKWPRVRSDVTLIAGAWVKSEQNLATDLA